MAWGLIRVGLFASAFFVGTVFHSPDSVESTASPVLNEEAGASLMVACKGGEVVVAPLLARPDAIQLRCIQSRMVVVRDHIESEKFPYINPIHTLVQ